MNGTALDGLSAMHCTAEYCQTAAVMVLAKAEANTEAADNYGCTLLHVVSTVADSSDVMRDLLRLGANMEALDGRGLTPLHFAAESGRPWATMTLLAVGADVTLRYGYEERSMLDCAAVEGHLDGMRILIEDGGVDANGGRLYRRQRLAPRRFLRPGRSDRRPG